VNNTSIKSVYLAQAVDLRDGKAIAAASNVKSALLSMKVVTFDPSGAFSLAGNVLEDPDQTRQGEYIFGVNLFAFLNADLRVFVYTGSASWGMPIELYTAVRKRLPFIFLDFTLVPKTPVYLRELFNLADAVDGLHIHSPLKTFLTDLVHNLPSEAREHLTCWTATFDMDEEKNWGEGNNEHQD